MNDPVQCSMCEQAWATTTWGFPVCQPCSDWLDRLHAELQAMPDPGVGPVLGGPSASYRERARKAIAARRSAELAET